MESWPPDVLGQAVVSLLSLNSALRLRRVCKAFNDAVRSAPLEARVVVRSARDVAAAAAVVPRARVWKLYDLEWELARTLLHAHVRYVCVTGAAGSLRVSDLLTACPQLHTLCVNEAQVSTGPAPLPPSPLRAVILNGMTTTLTLPVLRAQMGPQLRKLWVEWCERVQDAPDTEWDACVAGSPLLHSVHVESVTASTDALLRACLRAQRVTDAGVCQLLPLSTATTTALYECATLTKLFLRCMRFPPRLPPGLTHLWLDVPYDNPTRSALRAVDWDLARDTPHLVSLRILRLKPSSDTCDALIATVPPHCQVLKPE